jgi:uncharacterized protein (DUF169 family)
VNKEHLKKLVMKMNCALELDRKIVGAKFLFSKEEYEAVDAKHVKNKLNYCVMVKLAMSGKALKATGDDLVCIAGARAIGLKEIDDYHKSGQNGKRLGLYRGYCRYQSLQRDEDCAGLFILLRHADKL